jgi:tetratricopeptide (TPR) repeat protein/predicted aspartyl protease
MSEAGAPLNSPHEPRRLGEGADAWRASRVTVAAMIGLALAVPASVLAATSCRLGKMAEFPITMWNLRPLLTAKINGAEVRFLVDSGAFFSVISPGSAAELGLSTYPAPFGFYMIGVGGGSASVAITRVKEFTLAGVPLHNVEFLVGGSEVAGAGSIGVLGQNVLHIGDVEYDFGHGAVRLFKAEGCSKTLLAYWVAPTAAYSAVDIERTDRTHPFAMASATVNGVPIRVMFDTGAGVSMLSLKAAARAGVKPDSPGTVSAGVTWGFGKITIPSYVAPFSSFKIGEEEIKNTKLRIADIELPDADMLIGPDFFLSHRIMVANSQHRLYFTYNGGPVFNLTTIKRVPAAPANADAGSQTPPETGQEPSAEVKAGADARDAGELSRSAGALASRRQYEEALADVTRACALAPDNAEYLYQRATIHWAMTQFKEAIADLDRVLELEPNHVAARVSRAELLMHDGNQAAAVTDLNMASDFAPKEADDRFAMGRLYERADLLPQAIAQDDLWLAAHPDDARVPDALDSRCWARALAGTDLPLALKDCEAALRRTTKESAVFIRATGGRGLVLLRLGSYQKSITDYDVVVKANPKNAGAWYARGIDELHMGRTAEGRADIAQAVALAPKVAAEFNRHGIVE